jgi:hypothetical protein
MSARKETAAERGYRLAHARALDAIAEGARYAGTEAADRQREILTALDDENLPRLTAVTLARVAFTVELLARQVAELAERLEK